MFFRCTKYVFFFFFSWKPIHSVYKPWIEFWQFLLCLKKFAGCLLHINTGNALRSFDVAVCSHFFDLYLFQNKNNALLGHKHLETVTFLLIASFPFIVACYLGTTLAQNSGWATQLLQTSSVKENQHFCFLSWLYPLSAASFITTRAARRITSTVPLHSAVLLWRRQMREGGLVYWIPRHRHSLTQPVSGLFQTSSALTQLSHTQAKSLSQLHSTLLKVSAEKPNGRLFPARPIYKSSISEQEPRNLRWGLSERSSRWRLSGFGRALCFDKC